MVRVVHHHCGVHRALYYGVDCALQLVMCIVHYICGVRCASYCGVHRALYRGMHCALQFVLYVVHYIMGCVVHHIEMYAVYLFIV